jgi:hypothetical protein
VKSDSAIALTSKCRLIPCFGSARWPRRTSDILEPLACIATVSLVTMTNVDVLPSLEIFEEMP